MSELEQIQELLHPKADIQAHIRLLPYYFILHLNKIFTDFCRLYFLLCQNVNNSINFTSKMCKY